MKEKLINFFRDPVNVFLLIGITIGMILSVWLQCFSGAFTPPSEADFYELHKQEEIIMENFESVYSFENAIIYPNENETIIKLVSEEDSDYILKMTFTKRKEFVKSEEISEKEGFRTYPVSSFVDKTTPYFYTGIGGIALGALIGVLLLAIYKITVFIYRVAKIIFEKSKKH